VLDEDAVFAALRDGTIGGAALDVWWGHPRDPSGAPPSRHDFAALPNVLLTPHHAGHTDDTFRGRAEDIVANLAALATGSPLRNLVRG
jgi:phosphoglycerate dehydrogenase-like enzyme